MYLVIYRHLLLTLCSLLASEMNRTGNLFGLTRQKNLTYRTKQQSRISPGLLEPVDLIETGSL